MQTYVGISADSNNTILNSDAAAIDSLRITRRRITDLTGIGAFTALTYLYCRRNQLISLNVANGNNRNFINTSAGAGNQIANSFYAGRNPNLKCIQVDDVVYSIDNWSNIGSATGFSTDCSILSIITNPSTAAPTSAVLYKI